MDSKLKKWKNKRDLVKLLQYREYNAEGSRTFKQSLQFTDGLVKRLGLEFELEGHQGCVNCLQWTPDGKHLASGSDDTNIILWDPFRHKQLQVIPTHHIGNIFSVKFLGNECKEVATAAGDCRVLVQSVAGATSRAPPLLECSCHVNRVKRLATSPIEPSLFWSAAEDGFVIQYDLREKHECSSNGPCVLIDLSANFGEAKCIAVNPTKPNYLAVGANDCYVRMYDRRMLKKTVLGQTSTSVNTNKSTSEPPIDHNCVQYYAPGHLAVENAAATTFKLAATYVSFNSAGSEMLVNIGGEQIYLFDINNSRHIKEMMVPQSPGMKLWKNGMKKTCCCRHETNGFVNFEKFATTAEEKCPVCCYYMKRARMFYGRKWMGDLYNAARDYLQVIQRWPEHCASYIELIKCLVALKWTNEAQQWLEHFCSLHPDYTDNSQVSELRQKIESALKEEKATSANGGSGEGGGEDRDGSGTDGTDPISEEKERFLRRVDEAEQKKRLESFDFEVRFVGHCNTTTDIKEANFLGEDGQYVCAGSDEGFIFIWERRRADIVTVLSGDVSIVNCVQPHPTACFLASSGIDAAVKLWSPISEEDADSNPRLVKDIDVAIESNQQRMSMDPFESMLVNMGYRIPGISVDPAFQVFMEISSDVHTLDRVPSCRTC
ncbi:unnamed protein product [Callosobruchus maculatus]|uniref:WD and tetratricopeptide repeats protein 1 n=1 Tax=Callosobruchus maculatus TaxID=64391 RepID=A0A653CTD3_CALMS|nr:unnamed protein product [Callosobruchus maculatus]